MFLACQPFIKFDEISKLEIAAVSALCPLLAVSVLYFEKKIRNLLREYSKIRQFDTYQIDFLMRNQGQKSKKCYYLNVKKQSSTTGDDFTSTLKHKKEIHFS